MTPILAQTSATNDAFGSWVVIAAFCGGGLMLLLQIVAFFATRKELEALEKRQAEMQAGIEKRIAEHQIIHTEIFSKLGGQERGLRTESEAKITELRAKFDDLSRTISAVEAAANMHTSQLDQMNADMKAMPSQIIAQLSNLGVLKRPDRS